MSSRRSSSSSSRASKPSDDEIKELVLKLQPLLPQLHHSRNAPVSASSILEETCSYIKRLHREVEDLSKRLSQLLDSAGITDVDEELIRTLLRH
ncbi:transcription factor PRE6-like [Pyrus ussuriensis x Pyrus communis]|uniref:Transcription factor PRE6-like n=1 Tax=Pyrus ussuriensis x Pyrus communis TaxID=2448454 RepID=A0A5N5I0V3_9ROSA|nr:transcription factor PRE6-like [Pyrus ussuriensis x Pyrus communis]KAB2633499.1 transcription factor PRE6-like [Pyrus ussuriensis x Pyrus communis]